MLAIPGHTASVTSPKKEKGVRLGTGPPSALPRPPCVATLARPYKSYVTVAPSEKKGKDAIGLRVRTSRRRIGVTCGDEGVTPSLDQGAPHQADHPEQERLDVAAVAPDARRTVPKEDESDGGDAQASGNPSRVRGGPAKEPGATRRGTPQKKTPSEPHS